MSENASTNGQGTVHNFMAPTVRITFLEAELALVVEQKDTLYDQLVEARARVAELEAEVE